MSEKKPCPFCEGTGHAFTRFPEKWQSIRCQRCEMTTATRATYSEAAALWNRRATPKDASTQPVGLQEPRTDGATWECRDYADGWIGFHSLQAAAHYARETGALMRAALAAQATATQETK